MILSLYACIIGFMLDLLMGDPEWMFFHPIRLIGKMIMWGEKMLRRFCGKSERGQMFAGMILVIMVSLTSSLIPLLILYACNLVHPLCKLAVESIFCYFLLATKSLKVESMKVYKALATGDLNQGRKAVSMIVGRDVDCLDEEGVAKAAVETVAENTSDGILAPMFYMILGGASLGFFYKAINTMDSMIGYKNEAYLYFGRVAAKTDDVVNYIPSRLCAMFMILVSFLVPKFSGRDAIRIYKRDRRKSTSPNAGQTEAVCAGAMRIKLLGDAYYFGKLHKKATIGDAIEEVTIKKIVDVNQLLYATAVLGIVVLSVIKLVCMNCLMQ